MWRDTSMTAAKIALICMLLFLLACAPAIVFWAINTIAEESQMAWRIEHGFKSYLACWLLVAVFGRPGGALR